MLSVGSNSARLQLASIALVCAGMPLLGCGSGLVQVAGAVTLDGEPLALASVSFTPTAGGRPRSTSTDEAGRFRFDSAAESGLLPGDYKVTVSKTELTGLPRGAESRVGIPANFDTSQIKENWITPTRYAKSTTSGLTAKVTPGMPPLVLVLVSSE